MPRAHRYEVAGGVYHVMNRGVQRSDIVCDDRDRREWLRLLGRAAARCHWRVFAWALLDNHFHLFLRTPHPNLSAGMHALESGYATLFNRRHGRSGVLFEGRFRSVAVENESHSWELSRYVHLNSVRAGKVRHPLDDPWCSYRFYLDPQAAPGWLDWRSVLAQVSGTEAAARIAYRRFIEAGMCEWHPDPLQSAVDGWIIGGVEFIERCRQHGEALERAPTLDEIITAVQEVFGVPPAILSDAGRHGNLARDAAILLARERVPANLDTLAARFGARTRSTITAAARRAARRVTQDPAYAELIDKARTHCSGAGVENSKLR